MNVIRADPEEVRCNLECCTDEYKTRLDLKKAKELAKPDEQIYELDEPIKIFLFDVPKTIYAKRNMISAIFPLTTVFLGLICTMCLLFPFEGAYKEFSRNLHVPLSTIGMIYHVTPGMMAMCKFFDSSHVLKWVDRRWEHAAHMLVAFLFLMTGLALFAWFGEPEYDSLHAVIGMGAVVANLASIVSGFVGCLASKPKPNGDRGNESFTLYIHAYIGIVTYAIFIVTFATGLKGQFKAWLESIFGIWICFLFIGLTILMFVVSLIGPVLRFKANRARAKFERRLKKKKKIEEKARKKKEKLAKMRVPRVGRRRY